MRSVRIWRTLAGAVILTRDAIGFGYFQPEQFDQLQADLEAGVSLNKAVGVFSGSVYPLDRLRQVYLKESAKRVVIEWKEMGLSERDDFNFLSRQACLEFYDALMDELGPEFETRAARPGCGTLLVAVIALLIGLFFLFGSAREALGLGPPPPPGRPPLTGAVLAIMFGIAFVLLFLGVWFLRKYFAKPAGSRQERTP